jgi:hypothetical protein
MDLVGDPVDTRRIQFDFEEPPIALTATEPFPSRHIFLVQYSDPQSYGKAAGNPPCRRSMMQEHRQQSTSRRQLGALAHVLKHFEFQRSLYYCNTQHILLSYEHL